MTMRAPLIDAEQSTAIVPTFDPSKRYRYTWPGQPPMTVTGEEMTAICRGADSSKLEIEEVASSTSFSSRPSFRDPRD